MNTTTKQFISEMKKFADPKRAAFEKRYQKSHRVHLGISAPNMEKVIRSQNQDLNEAEIIHTAQQLWATNIFDFMVAATRLLKLKKIQKNKTLWMIGKKFLKDCDGWALEDGLSYSMRQVLISYPVLLDEVEKWTTNKNFWMRRAALVFTLPYAKAGMNPERMLKWAGEYAEDREWFIQKAIGWWLRDLGAHNPQRVIEFLEQHWGKLMYVAKKEATRKLDAKWTKKISHLIHSK